MLQVTFRKAEHDWELRTLFDANDIGVTYTRALLVWTFADSAEFETRRDIFSDYLRESVWGSEFLPGVCVSSESGDGIVDLKKAIFEGLNLVRVYTKDPAQNEPDLKDPIALPRGSTVLDLARDLHEELAANFYQARIWEKEDMTERSSAAITSWKIKISSRSKHVDQKDRHV